MISRAQTGLLPRYALIRRADWQEDVGTGQDGSIEKECSGQGVRDNCVVILVYCVHIMSTADAT
jgi:hypothetical protein